MRTNPKADSFSGHPAPMVSIRDIRLRLVMIRDEARCTQHPRLRVIGRDILRDLSIPKTRRWRRTQLTPRQHAPQVTRGKQWERGREGEQQRKHSYNHPRHLSPLLFWWWWRGGEGGVAVAQIPFLRITTTAAPAAKARGDVSAGRMQERATLHGLFMLDLLGREFRGHFCGNPVLGGGFWWIAGGYTVCSFRIPQAVPVRSLFFERW